LRYVFRDKKAAYLQNNKHMLYKNREMFKLFEDNDPRFISFEELVPNIYSKEEVSAELSDEKVQQSLKYINLLPGGK
jgi:Ca2+-binding EF-hand superfamily protein